MKLGKEESAEETGSDTSNNKTDEENKPPTTDQTTESSAQDKNKEDVENLRTVIKVKEEVQTDEKKEEPSSEEKIEEPPNKEPEEKTKDNIPPKAPDPITTQTSSPKEELEQKRQLLQSIKDFDYQIKKNQENIGKIDEKIGGLTKDLDDLVSLYEIVSEQMNPFVGLSKVTKKRIDALENFTKEIEDIKTRMGDVESELEKGIGGIRRFNKELEKKSTSPEQKKVENDAELEESAIKTEDEINSSSLSTTTPLVLGDLSEDDQEKILSKSLESLFNEQSIDNLIDEFLLRLK